MQFIHEASLLPCTVLPGRGRWQMASRRGGHPVVGQAVPAPAVEILSTGHSCDEALCLVEGQVLVIWAVGGFSEQNTLGNATTEFFVEGSVFSKFLIHYSLMLFVTQCAWRGFGSRVLCSPPLFQGDPWSTHCAQLPTVDVPVASLWGPRAVKVVANGDML